MTTSIEYNTDLALYSHEEFKKGRKKLEECLPEELTVGSSHPFLKVGHRNYAINSTVTLLEIKKFDVLFQMRAQVEIVEAFFLLDEDQSYTRGTYIITEILTD